MHPEMQVLVTCPQCGNKVDGRKSCPFCEYAQSIGIPEELVAVETTSAGGGNFDFAILNSFLNNKFMLQKAMENSFVPEMLELNQAQRFAKHLVQIYEEEAKNEAWDKFILRARLKAKGHLPAAMDHFYSKILEVPTPSLEQLMSYLAMARGSYSLRVVKQLSEEMTRYTNENAWATQDQIDKFVAGSVDKLRSLQKLSGSKRINLVKKELEGIMNSIESREKHGEIDIIGYTITPFNVLNTTISGLRRGFMYCLAGAPRRGKTNLALDVATYCARENKIPVLFFTFEQTKMNLTYRLLSKESYLNPGVLQRKRLLNDPVKKAKLADGIKKMSEYRDYMYIVEATKEDTIEKIRGQAYNIMQEHDTNDIVIFIDYIQKMPLSMKYDNEKFKTEEISTGLKALSIELNCPVFAISSLSKEGCQIDETDCGTRPTFFHCKGSGDIEYDVDSAMVLGKDWADTKELYEQLKHKAEALGKDSTRLPKVDIVNLYVDKNRDAPEGILGIIQFFFFIEENRYVELGYKLDTDVYRFKKIEGLVNILVDKGFIRFYDINEPSTEGQFEQMVQEKEEMFGGPQKRIRLKY